MKKLTTEEVNKLSMAELDKYMDAMYRYEWSIKSNEERDRDLVSIQNFVANKRNSLSSESLEERIETILNPSSIPENYSHWQGGQFAGQIRSHQERVKKGEVFTFFWSTKSPFSQWHLSKFIASTLLMEGINDLYEERRKHALLNLFPYEKQQYTSAEQFMMYHKAMIFLDREVAKKIMSTDNPRTIKELGRRIKNFDEVVWKYFRSKVVYEGNKAKYTQNDYLREALFATQGTTLVEAAPNDTVWGVGLAEGDSGILSRNTWLGKNLLGEILTQIRIELMGEY